MMVVAMKMMIMMMMKGLCGGRRHNHVMGLPGQGHRPFLGRVPTALGPRPA